MWTVSRRGSADPQIRGMTTARIRGRQQEGVCMKSMRSETKVEVEGADVRM